MAENSTPLLAGATDIELVNEVAGSKKPQILLPNSCVVGEGVFEALGEGDELVEAVLPDEDEEVVREEEIVPLLLDGSEAKLLLVLVQELNKLLVGLGKDKRILLQLAILLENMAHYLLVFMHTQNLLFLQPLTMHLALRLACPLVLPRLPHPLSLVNEEIGVPRFVFLGVPVAKGFFWEFAEVEGADFVVIELEPPARLGLDEGVVVPTVCTARVDDHSPQLIVEEFIGIHLVGLVALGEDEVAAEFLGGELLEVELGVELAVMVDFDFGQGFEVELEPLEGEDEVGGELLDALDPLGLHLPVAQLAEVLVLPIQPVHLHERLEALIDVLLHLQAHRNERLLPLRTVRTLQRHYLVQVHSFKQLPDYVRSPDQLQLPLQLLK